VLQAGKLFPQLPGLFSTMILVTGAPGKTGRAVIQALAKSRARIRALAHRSDQVAELEALGVDDVVVGDLTDEACVVRAVKGARAIYHMAPNVSPDEVAIGRIVIAAAKGAGVEHFVFHSVLHPQIEAMPHHWRKLRVEELLLESGLPCTILQPTTYMQHILTYWDQIFDHGMYLVPYSLDTRLSLVDLEDVAQAAAIVLTEPGRSGATIELVGTPAMSQTEVAEVLHGQLGRPVTAAVVPIELWEKGARASGLGDYQVSTLIQMFQHYERHGFVGNSSGLACLLHREPTSLAAFVARIARLPNDAPRAG
jgi:NAD(P)H dehydrogenase (quinone)